MGLLNFFSGKTPADYERTGDTLAQGHQWGEAKLAFESALDKLAKQSSADPAMSYRLRQKLQHSKEALAMAQHQEALGLIDAGCMEEACELLTLAIELTNDAQLKEALAQNIKQIALSDQPEIQVQFETAAFGLTPDEPGEESFENGSDDHFDILLGALPDDIQQAYRSYGYHFKQGYLALNQGTFDQAVEHLTQAAEENPSPQSLVPLELATALVNLREGTKARPLLEKLIQHQPDLLPAYQLLCEIYWDGKDFDQAILMLDTLPTELAESMGAYQLRGETLLKAARNQEAQTFFQDLLKAYGWSETIALGLARAFEGLGQIPQARDVYGQVISQCSGCGTRIPSAIRRKYADLGLASGQYTNQVLEHYLALAQEDPSNAVQYYQNISRIYSAQGNETESRRFQAIAEELARQQA